MKKTDSVFETLCFQKQRGEQRQKQESRSFLKTIITLKIKSKCNISPMFN
jgi:hypothetical protein